MKQNSAHSTPRQVVECLYEAFNRGDLKTIVEQLANTLDWHESENCMLWDRSPYLTPAAVEEGVFGRLAVQLRGCLATPITMFEVGDTILALGRIKGMFNATGRSFNAEYVHIWHVQNGRIVGFRQVIDTLAIWRAQQGL